MNEKGKNEILQEYGGNEQGELKLEGNNQSEGKFETLEWKGVLESNRWRPPRKNLPEHDFIY